MDIFTSVFTIYGNVSDTDRQYKILSKKLSYEVKKAEHLLQKQKIKMVPKFMKANLENRLNQAKIYLQKIQNLLTEDRISLKQKIKLSLPFNKTNAQVKSALEQLQKAQQDVNQYEGPIQIQNNGKRSIQDFQKMQKKSQTIISILPNQQPNDQDIDQAFMGPTIQENAAIEFTKNKYILLSIQIHGEQKFINVIKQANPDFLVFKKKIQIKFQNANTDPIQQLQLFELGRLYFKPVYSKLKSIYADIDRISKQNHFIVILKRKRENLKSQSKFIQEEKQQIPQSIKRQLSAQKSSQKIQGDQFFSFPCTGQQMVTRQTDTIIVRRSPQKNVYISDASGIWTKMDQIETEICKGEEIAPFIPPNRNPQIPDLYFKIDSKRKIIFYKNWIKVELSLKNLYNKDEIIQFMIIYE